MFNVQFPTQSLSAVTTAIKDGTHGTHRRVAEGVPLLSAKNITANGEIAFDYTDDRISESEYLDLARSFRLEPDDLLLTIVGSLGRRAIYSGQRITFQRSVAYIRPQQQKMRSRFLFHWMGHSAFSAELKRRSNATAQAGLYLGELAKVSVPVPEVREQKAIAQISDRADPRHPRHRHPRNRGDHRQAQGRQAGPAARPARHRRQRRTAPAASRGAASLQGVAAGVDSEGVGHKRACWISTQGSFGHSDWTFWFIAQGGALARERQPQS